MKPKDPIMIHPYDDDGSRAPVPRHAVAPARHRSTEGRVRLQPSERAADTGRNRHAALVLDSSIPSQGIRLHRLVQWPT